MKIRMTVATLALVTVVAITAPSATAAPANAKDARVLTLDCGQAGSIDVLVKFSSGGASTFDATVETNGRQYELVSLAGRFYEGTLTTEPSTEPVFEFAHEYGQRNGYSTQLVCTAGPEGETNKAGTFTGWFDVTLAAK